MRCICGLENGVYAVRPDSITGFNKAFGLLTKEPNKRVLTFSLVDYLTNKTIDFKKYDVILFKNYEQYANHFDTMLKELGKHSVVVLGIPNEHHAIVRSNMFNWVEASDNKINIFYV